MEGRTKRDSQGRILNVRPLMEQTLGGIRRKSLFQEFKRIDSAITSLRDSITHFARGASILAEGFYYIPERLPRNAVWSQQWRIARYQETRARAKQDISRLERLIDRLHRSLMTKIDIFFQRNSIKVRN